MKMNRKKLVRWSLIGGLVLVLLIVLLLLIRSIIIFPEIALKPLLANELLNTPVYLIEFPGQQGKMVVAEKQGILKWFSSNSDQIGGIVMDIHTQVQSDTTEEGMLNLIFHPNFQENHYFYLYYTKPDPLRIVVSRWTMNPQTIKADLESEKVLFEYEKAKTGHNGGQLAFGPDGFLYIGFGEGGKLKLVEDMTRPFGKIVRIDVSEPDSEKGYTIPADNPFMASKDGTMKEIWAYGFRNPWRFSFDKATGELFLGDVGHLQYEEINVVHKGQNYGYPLMEGIECYQDFPDCQTEGLVLPVAALSRIIIRVIIGGHVYRGEKIPQLQGRYIFGDFFRGIFSIPSEVKETRRLPNYLLFEPISPHPLLKDQRVLISSFAEDATGELYVLDMRGGIYQIANFNLIDWLWSKVD